MDFGGAADAPPDVPPVVSRSPGMPIGAARLIGWVFALVLIGGASAFAVVDHRSAGWIETWPWTSADRSRGLAAFSAGQLDLARSAFRAASAAHPRDPLPHIYLARIARETGDLATARAEATSALRVAPHSAETQREMGAYLLADGRPELAQRFFVRAIAIDSDDRASQGWLACALARVGQHAAATRWLQRAGPGIWSACVTESSSPSS
jgi:Tfp pilus assembly protein PilF